MNAHVDGIIFKDTFDARIRSPEPAQKGQRKPLGLAPANEEVAYPSALDGRSADELTSPATIGNVLEALDAAIAVRSDLDAPLHVRLSRLESSNGALRSELEAAKAERAKLNASVTALQATVASLLKSRDQAKLAASLASTATKQAELKVVK